jgi:hypothetical protein
MMNTVAMSGSWSAARLERGTAAEGEAVARQFLERTNVLQDADITVDRGPETVTVTVVGEAWSPSPTSVTVTMTALLGTGVAGEGDNDDHPRFDPRSNVDPCLAGWVLGR